MRIVTLPTSYYQQFDANYSLEVPAEGYGGWKKENLRLNIDTTALVLMHTWDCGSRDEHPGWFRSVEYIERSYEIAGKVFPDLLKTARKADMKVYHVVSGSEVKFYKDFPGYSETVSLAGEYSEGVKEFIKPDPVYDELNEFRTKYSFPGSHNINDIKEGVAQKDFLKEAVPANNEGIAEDAHQLYALCNRDNINHLIYTGFAINWCLLLSPGGMWEMQKKGIICSTIRQAVTAVENKETARKEICKELGLWRVGMSFGFVYDIDDFTLALSSEF